MTTSTILDVTIFGLLLFICISLLIRCNKIYEEFCNKKTELIDEKIRSTNLHIELEKMRLKLVNNLYEIEDKNNKIKEYEKFLKETKVIDIYKEKVVAKNKVEESKRGDENE